MKRQIYKLKDTAQTDYTTLDPQNLHLFVDESEESGGGAVDSVMVLLNDATSSASLTGTTTETQIGSSILIPANTFASGETFTIDVQFNRNATAISTAIFRIRMNTVNTFVSSTFLATAASGIANFSCPVIRTACFKNTTTLEILNINQSLNNDTTANSVSQVSTVTFDTTIDNYLFLSGQLFNVADSFYLSRVTITKRKSKTTI